MRCKVRNILVVEDEAFIAWDIQQMLESNGFAVIGPAHSLSEGHEVAAENHLCAALLDINLGQQVVWPLASKLMEHDVPILFLSADLAHEELKTTFRDVPRLSKPVREIDLVEALNSRLVQASCSAES